jgi:hypothetical protein
MRLGGRATLPGRKGTCPIFPGTTSPLRRFTERTRVLKGSFHHTRLIRYRSAPDPVCPSGVVRLRLDYGPAGDCAGQTKGHHHRSVNPSEPSCAQ